LHHQRQDQDTTYGDQDVGRGGRFSSARKAAISQQSSAMKPSFSAGMSRAGVRGKDFSPRSRRIVFTPQTRATGASHCRHGNMTCLLEARSHGRSGSMPDGAAAGTIATPAAIGGLMPPRSWGWWTEQKLDILGDYLSAFTRASKKAGQTVYLDLFAGQPDNVSRDREQRVIRGSARRALDTQPPLSNLRFFELAANASSLEQALTAEYPGRASEFKVMPGDCNATITTALAELADLNWAPTFAFLDQQSTEVQWPTIERLARHKREGMWKTELWLCASGLLPGASACETRGSTPPWQRR